MWRRVGAYHLGAALGRFFLKTLSTAGWQLYSISAITFKDEPPEFAALGVLAPCEFAECAWSSPGKRMRARSNEWSVKSCMAQRNWGWRAESRCRWGERSTFFFFYTIANPLKAGPDCPTGLALFQLQNHQVAAAVVDFPTVKHTDKLLLVVSQASFVPAFSASPPPPLLLCGKHMRWLFHYSVKDSGDRLLGAHGCCLPCCRRASLAACSMACFSSFLISLSWAACRAISATWWNTLRPLQVVLRGQSADTHVLQTNWSK